MEIGQPFEMKLSVPQMTAQEITELEIFREKCMSMKAQAGIMTFINPDRYGQMKAYIDRLSGDIDAFYNAFKVIREDKRK